MAYNDFSMDNQWLPFTPNRAFKKDPRVFVAADGSSVETSASSPSMAVMRNGRLPRTTTRRVAELPAFVPFRLIVLGATVSAR